MMATKTTTTTILSYHNIMESSKIDEKKWNRWSWKNVGENYDVILTYGSVRKNSMSILRTHIITHTLTDLPVRLSMFMNIPNLFFDYKNM
jgi:hypothetical protein